MRDEVTKRRKFARHGERGGIGIGDCKQLYFGIGPRDEQRPDVARKAGVDEWRDHARQDRDAHRRMAPHDQLEQRRFFEPGQIGEPQRQRVGGVIAFEPRPFDARKVSSDWIGEPARKGRPDLCQRLALRTAAVDEGARQPVELTFAQIVSGAGNVSSSATSRA